MKLHILNKPGSRTDILQPCLRACQPGDALLLIEDGVLNTLPGAPLDALIASGAELYALASDLEARGLQQLPESAVQRIDDAGFVKLCENYSKILSWY